MRAPIQHQQRPSWPAQLVPTIIIEGQAWMVPWSEPRFRRDVPAHLMPTEFVALTPATLPVPIDGMAWYGEWQPPHFPIKTAYFLQQFSPSYGTDFALPVPIEGVAWWMPFDQPEQRKTRSTDHQFFSAMLVPETLPVMISGMAWQKSWEPPFYPTRVKPWLIPTNFVALTPATLPVSIQGMAWYQPFSQPEQVRVSYQKQQYALNVQKHIWTGTVFAYIMGGAR